MKSKKKKTNRFIVSEKKKRKQYKSGNVSLIWQKNNAIPCHAQLLQTFSGQLWDQIILIAYGKTSLIVLFTRTVTSLWTNYTKENETRLKGIFLETQKIIVSPANYN